jgi:GT2 family glycosyltransferase
VDTTRSPVGERAPPAPDVLIVVVDGDDDASTEPASGVDVCIVSHNSASVLAETIASIIEHVPTARISIREHGSDPVAIAMLHRIADRPANAVRLEFDATNPGFGAGCNALARGGSAPWLLFLNPDARILAWPWSATVPPPTGAVIGPFMEGRGQAERHSGVSYRTVDEIKRSWFRRYGPRPAGRGFVSGAALLVDRASFERVGGFDERYFMFYEDIDLCLRANDLGVVTVIESRWRVRHEGAHATSQHFGESLIWSYESACRFRNDRHESVLFYRAYVVADAIIRCTRALLRRDRQSVDAYAGLIRVAARRSVEPVPSAA